MGILSLVNSKYNFNLSSLDLTLLDKSVYESIELISKANKVVSLDRASKVVKDDISNIGDNVLNVVSMYSDTGIKFKISDKKGYELSNVGIFSRAVFSNVAYVNNYGKLISNYGGDILLSYIPVSGYYTYNPSTDMINECTHLTRLISSVYAKNHIVNMVASMYSKTESEYDSIKSLLEARLSEDDIEIASGYLNELGVDIQSLQGTIATNDTLLKLISSDIQSDVEELQ